MTKPLSMDIRERAMARLDAGETVRVVAEALSVAPSSVVKWSQRRRTTGSAAPGKIGGHVPRKITGEQASWLRARMAAGAFTLRGLVGELAERGLRVDYRTMWTFVHAEGLSFKENHARQRAGAAGRCPQARPLEGASGQHRPQAACLHRCRGGTRNRSGGGC